MQGTVVMLMALSGLGCHNKSCDVVYAPPLYSCFSGGCYANVYPPAYVSPSCYSGCYSSGYSGCYSGQLCVRDAAISIENASQQFYFVPGVVEGLWRHQRYPHRVSSRSGALLQLRPRKRAIRASAGPSAPDT